MMFGCKQTKDATEMLGALSFWVCVFKIKNLTSKIEKKKKKKG